MKPLLGQLVRSFFEDYLVVQRGLRLNTVRSYRDILRLFLEFLAKDCHRKVSRLTAADLTFEGTERFLRHLEDRRQNQARTRNQRLAGLRTFFEYLGLRLPELLELCQRVSCLPAKRQPPRTMQYLEAAEVHELLDALPCTGGHALRDRTLLLFLYNTGARVQEVADLHQDCLDLGEPPRTRLYGKGGKWRTCPLWQETAALLRRLIHENGAPDEPTSPVFQAHHGIPLTRFGLYKIVRRCAGHLDRVGAHPRHVSPHLFRHTAAVHLLESGVEINVIRCWLGHASLETTNHYAEVSLRLKEKALRVCEAPLEVAAESRSSVVWREDKKLLDWLASL